MDTQWKKVESNEKQFSLIFSRHVSLSWQKCSFVVEFYRPSYKSLRVQGAKVDMSFINKIGGKAYLDFIHIFTKYYYSKIILR